MAFKRLPKNELFFDSVGRGGGSDCCSLVTGDTAVVVAATATGVAGPTTAEAGSAAPVGDWSRRGGSGDGAGGTPSSVGDGARAVLLDSAREGVREEEREEDLRSEGRDGLLERLDGEQGQIR